MKARTFEFFQQAVIDKIYPGSISVPASLQRLAIPPAAAGGARQITLTNGLGKRIIMCGITKCGDKDAVCG